MAGIAGLGPFVWLAPRGCARLGLPLACNLGLGLIAVVATHIVYLNLPIGDAALVAMGLSIAALVLNAILRPKHLLSELFAALRTAHTSWSIGSLGLLVALLAIWPAVRAGGEQPYRVGVDEIGYAITAQYLRDGGTRKSLEAAVIRETGQPSLREALAANVTALDFDVDVASEFILKSQRYGYSGMLASIAELLGAKRVVAFQMCFLVFPIWLLFAVAFSFLSEDLGITRPVAVAWSASIALNCNLLNVLCEGQHAQIFTSALMGLIFVFWWRWRRNGGISAGFAEGGALATFLFAIVAATYFEQIIALGAVAFLVVIGDLIYGKPHLKRGNLVLVFACALGCCLTGGYMADWAPRILHHTANMARGGGGFWQPQWAQPVDIAGYVDIYNPAVSTFVGRGVLQALGLGIVSLALVEATLVVLWRSRAADSVFWAAPLVFVAIVFVKSFYLDHIHNYNYMKAYTFMLFPIVSLHAWTSGIAWTRLGRRLGGTGQMNEAFRAALPVWAILVGILYLHRYESECRTLPKGVEALSSQVLRRKLRDSAVVVGGFGGVGNMMLGAYSSLPWLNLGWADPYLPPSEGKPILFLALKRDLPFPDQIERKYRGSMLVDNDAILLIDTGRTVNVPPDQRTRRGLAPTNSDNPDKLQWPTKLGDQWDEIVFEVRG